MTEPEITQPASAPPTAVPSPATIAPVRPRGSALRWTGNLLIAVGLLLLLGVGGYLGITTYQNNQEAEQIQRESINLPPPALPPSTSGTTSQTPAGTPLPGVNPPAATPTFGSNTVVVGNTFPNLNAGPVGARQVGMVQGKPPVRLVIPSLSMDWPIVPISWEMIPGKDGQSSAQWKVADYAVGHHQGTANPGEVGNVVLSGHDDWKGEVFRDLHKIQRGAEVTVYTDDQQFLYIVQDIKLVLEEGPDVTDAMRAANAAYMNPTPDPTLTMITCWPYGVDDHRIIVIAKPYNSGLPTRPDLALH